MSNEIWRPIKGYETEYMVSNLGRVKSLYREVNCGKGKSIVNEKYLTPHTNAFGYLTINLSKRSKTKSYLIHRLVAQAFIPNPENKPEVDHINTIRDDNNVKNLRWVTRQENNSNPLRRKKYSRCRKGYRNSNAMAVIKIEPNGKRTCYQTLTEGAHKNNVSPSTISYYIHGIRKPASGDKWIFSNTK